MSICLGYHSRCFGWWADRMAFDGTCVRCNIRQICHKSWVESGGRIGGYFDKAVEGKV